MHGLSRAFQRVPPSLSAYFVCQGCLSMQVYHVRYLPPSFITQGA
jgi:hypothetical protein